MSSNQPLDAWLHRPAIEAWRADRPTAVFLDYDGTLTPIVSNPAAATLSPTMRSKVETLAKRARVAIVSGRDREDVRARVELPDLVYAGGHGFDIAGPAVSMQLPAAERARDSVRRAERELRERVGDVDGVLIESKRFSVAVHVRNLLRPGDEQRVRLVIEDLAERIPELRIRTGKKVFELEPDLDWDKGAAIEWILDALGVSTETSAVIYVGDDDTDEDAFVRLGARALGIRVGAEGVATAAAYRLASPEAVGRFLGWLGERLDAGR